MGLLVDGVWHDTWYDTGANKGKFVRSEAQFRNWITADGGAGIAGKAGFKAEAGRYHLYISNACPWAHRVIIFRAIKGLNDMIDISVTHPYMVENGWTFAKGDGVIADSVNGAEFVHQIYTTADPDYSGRVTVPILWDKQLKTIVSNESSEIIRMLNSEFDGVGAVEGDYYPAHLRAEIDVINERIYHTINNGVYKSGFATTQEAYEEAVVPLFDSLDWVDGILGEKRYLCGDVITEADWRLFTTLIRFDAVYFGHFKCNLKMISQYKNLSGYVRELYQIDGIAETVNMEHNKRHYYESHDMVNPTRIVPVGPLQDFNAPHGRG